MIRAYFSFIFQEYIPIEESLEFTKYLANENDAHVWSAVMTSLQKLRNLWSSTDNSTYWEALTEYMQPRVEAARQSVAQLIRENPEESSSIRILYTQLLDWSCALNSPFCVDLTKSLFDQWAASPETNP